jgi:hypothetical protein
VTPSRRRTQGIKQWCSAGGELRICRCAERLIERIFVRFDIDATTGMYGGRRLNMGSPGQDNTQLSRRTVLTGLGTTGLGVAATTIIATAATAAEAPTIDTAVAAQLPQQSQVFGAPDFYPVSSATGYAEVTLTNPVRYGRGPVAAGGGAFAARLTPPGGARVTTVDVFVQAPSGGSVPVRVEEVRPSDGVVSVLASGNGSGAGQQRVTLALDYTVGQQTELRAVCDLAASAAVFGAQVTFTPAATRRFIPITPHRRFGSRTSGGKLRSGSDISISYSDLPAEATAVVVNITVTGTTAAGWVAAYPEGLTYPGISTVDWGAAGQTIANGTTVGFPSSRAIRIRCHGGDTHVIIDDLGYHIA